MTRSVFVVALAGLAACSSAPLPVPPTTADLGALNVRGGCGDLVAYAATPDDTLALVVLATGVIVVEIHTATQPTKRIIHRTLPDSAWLVQIRRGAHLTDGFCADSPATDVGNVALRYDAVEGTVDLTVLPDNGILGGTAIADLVVDGLHASTYDNTQHVTVPMIEIPRFPVAWYSN